MIIGSVLGLLIWVGFAIALIRANINDARLEAKQRKEMQDEYDRITAAYLERAAESKRWAQPQVDDKLRRAWGEIE